MTKKILIILIVLVLLIGGMYVYFAYFKKAILPTFRFRAFPTTREIPTEQPLLGGPAEIKKGALSVLVGEPVIGATLSREKDSVLYMLRENGNLYRINFDGQEKNRISNTTIIGVYQVRWSPDKSKIFITYENNDRIKNLVFDLASIPSASSILPSNISSASWSPDSKTLRLLEKRSHDVGFITTSATGKNIKHQFTIPLADLVILPSNGASIFFTEAPSGLVQGPLFQLNSVNGSFKEILNGFGLGAIISQDENWALISATNEKGSLLPLTRVTIKNNSKIIIPNILTLAEKCAFANNETIFCGIPQTIPKKSIMPDSYYKGDASLTDHLVKINTQTLETTSYEDVVSGFDMQDIFTDERGENVFFRDAKTDFLYRFSLPR